MTTLTQPATGPSKQRPVNRPLALIISCVCVAVMVDPAALGVVIDAISEAYLQVSTFVAATLLVFFSLEKLFKFDLTEALAGGWSLAGSLSRSSWRLAGMWRRYHCCHPICFR